MAPTFSTGVMARYPGHTNIASPSYFNHNLPGCGAVQIVVDGLPALGQVFSFALVNAQGLPALVLGTNVPPVPMCAACQFGVDPATAVLLLTPDFSMRVPGNTAFIAFQFAVQGLDFLAPGGCVTPILATLTDKVVVTLL